MSTVNSNIKIGKKDAAFFAANPALVLLDGQLIYNEDTGDLFIGDGVTPLIGLTPINSGFTPSGTNLDYIAGDGSYIIFPTDNAAFTNGAGYLSSGDISVTVQAYDGDTTILGNGVVGDSVVVTDSNGLLDSVTLASGESIRRNALDTAFEGFTALTSGDLAPYLTSATAALTYQPIGTYLTPSAIGVTVQAYSANTTLLGNSTTGSGSIVLATSPTFGTNITTPLIYGSTSSGGNLTLQSTTNATRGKILFGTSGYDEVNNRLGIGTSSPSQLLHVSTTTAGQGILSGNVYLGVAKNLTVNYAEFSHNSSSQYALAQLNNGQTFFNGITSCTFSVGTNPVMTLTDRRLNVNPAAITSGSQNTFTVTVPANTGQTAGTNISNFQVTGNTKTWAAGTITNQYWSYFTANTAAFASASTITNSYGLYVEAATAGTNATITNNYAAGFGGNVNIVSGHLRVNGTQVVTSRDTGWTAFTNTTNKATAYDTATVTLQQLAERVAAIQAALTTHGLIGT